MRARAVDTEQPGTEELEHVARGQPDLSDVRLRALLSMFMRSHDHCDPVTMPDGTIIGGAAFPVRGYERDEQPDFGLYLDPLWKPPWPHAYIVWPDFGIPDSRSEFRSAIEDLHQRAMRGQSVEVGCLGGHGRTGTALACIAVLAGLEEDPVRWLRARYCHLAIETDEQADLARGFREAN